jgi:hypothetical protein
MISVTIAVATRRIMIVDKASLHSSTLHVLSLRSKHEVGSQLDYTLSLFQKSSGRATICS